MEKTRNADSVKEYKDQRCVQHMVKNTENARRTTIGQDTLKARLLMKQNNI